MVVSAPINPLEKQNDVAAPLRWLLAAAGCLGCSVAAGIGFTVPLLKSRENDFIGRTVLEERKEHPQRQLVGLDLEGGVVPSNGDCVCTGRAQVGEITSALKSPILGNVIVLDRYRSEVGQLDGLQKGLDATVVAFPHFDPTTERVTGNYP